MIWKHNIPSINSKRDYTSNKLRIINLLRLQFRNRLFIFYYYAGIESAAAIQVT